MPLLFLQALRTVPDTSAYYRAAYIAAAVLYGGYVLSLWFRARRVRERMRPMRDGAASAR
jgi:hypothetical protein